MNAFKPEQGFASDGARNADVELTMGLVKLLMQSATTVGSVVDDVLAEFEVSPSVAGVLWALDPLAKSATMREIAARLGCDPSTISLLADKLESSRLVARQRHPDDGRKRVLALTARGEELWVALSTRLHGTPTLAGLSLDDRRQLAALLAKIQP